MNQLESLVKSTSVLYSLAVTMLVQLESIINEGIQLERAMSDGCNSIQLESFMSDSCNLVQLESVMSDGCNSSPIRKCHH